MPKVVPGLQVEKLEEMTSRLVDTLFEGEVNAQLVVLAGAAAPLRSRPL
jgi:hypothetical protein